MQNLDYKEMQEKTISHKWTWYYGVMDIIDLTILITSAH